MTPEELKYQALKNDIDSLSNKLGAVSNTIDKLANKLDPDAKSQKTGLVEKLEGWLKSLILILGIPGIIVTLFIQLRQPDNVKADTESKLAEARQKNAEAMKLEREIQASIDTIKLKSTKDIEAYNSLLNDNLPNLQTVINQFENARVQAQNQNIMFKYIILWVIFIGLGGFFELFSTFWSSLVTFSYLIIDRRSTKVKNENTRRRFRNISQFAIVILSPFPTILKIIIEISIFFALMVPIFNETAILLNSDKSFESVSKEFSKLHVGKAIDTVRQIIIK
jgi:hypothetical protein